jgi:DNA-directed RNA polymerase specialized sigma24 family protein
MLGYTVEETAQVTGVPPNTVRSRLRTALKALREVVLLDGARLEIVREES